MIEVPGIEGEEGQIGGVWITSATTCRIENFRGGSAIPV